MGGRQTRGTRRSLTQALPKAASKRRKSPGRRCRLEAPAPDPVCIQRASSGRRVRGSTLPVNTASHSHTLRCSYLHHQGPDPGLQGIRDTLLCSFMPYYTLFPPIIPYYALLCPVMPHHALLHPIISYYALIYPIIPYHTQQYPSIPFAFYRPNQSHCVMTLEINRKNLEQIHVIRLLAGSASSSGGGSITRLTAFIASNECGSAESSTTQVSPLESNL